MHILDIGRAQFAETRRKHIAVIEVPEWQNEKGETVKVYVRPLNLFEQSERDTRAVKEDYAGYNLSTLIHSACDENMKPLFKDTPTVRKILEQEFCPKVLTRLFVEISKVQREEASSSLEDLETEKKS